MIKKDLAGQRNFFAVIFIGKKFTLKSIHFFFPQHAFEAVQQKHLGLGVDENIFEAVSISMIQ